MKSIELTKDHKSKLLEMCKELFPEYVIYPADNDGFIEGEQWVGDQNMGEDRPVNEFNIHWFEFCILWLATIIYNKRKTNNFSILEYRGFLCQSVEHPIDFLYEEFKKLK